MNGLGNDFIVIDNFNGRIKFSSEQIVALCDRHKGIGADGLILVEKKPKVDCFMNYYNADGSEAEMCGNGIRCTALFLKNYYLKDNQEFKIETRVGIKIVKLEKDGTFSVNMGKPIFSHSDFPERELELEGLLLNFVSVGNPHAVSFVNDLENIDLEKIGSIIENNSNFPNKINLEIVEQKSSKEFRVKVWERGCGETLACGTGACAVYAIAKRKKYSDSEIIINLPGGQLFIQENEVGEIILRGEAKGSFSGIFEID